MTRVLVVGAGISGTAAALAAVRAGADVSLVAAGSGATRFAGGALDREPWEQATPVAPLGADVALVLDALGGAFIAPTSGALVATAPGILRPARAIDSALLDLAPLHDGEVLVPSADRPGWDAEALARSWTAASEATARRLTFVAASLPIIRHLEERAFSDADVAALLDEPDRLEWLRERLSSPIGARRPAAIVLPPCLGVDRARAATLSARVGVPCGEAVTGLAGPSGMRFERARDRALDAAGVARFTGRVTALTFDVRWHAGLEAGDPLQDFDAVVLGTGGLVGGGLEYRPGGSVLATELPPSAGALIRATIAGPLAIGVRATPIETPSSLFGAAPESHAWPFVRDGTLEQAGVLVDDEGRVRGAPRGLYAGGDLVADHPRTWLEALWLGARAGTSAAGASSQHRVDR